MGVYFVSGRSFSEDERISENVIPVLEKIWIESFKRHKLFLQNIPKKQVEIQGILCYNVLSYGKEHI